jgi:ParB-like chromosome segregation protein Spo0J
LHPEREIVELMKAIQFYGFTAPVFLSKADDTLIAGKARVMAAQRLGMETVRAIHLDLKPEEYDAYAILDNRLPEFASWDYMKLLSAVNGIADPSIAENIAYTPEELGDIRHWQEESVSGVDLDDMMEKTEKPTIAGPEMIEILLVVPLSTWKQLKPEIESALQTLTMAIPGLKYSAPRVKELRVLKT